LFPCLGERGVPCAGAASKQHIAYGILVPSSRTSSACALHTPQAAHAVEELLVLKDELAAKQLPSCVVMLADRHGNPAESAAAAAAAAVLDGERPAKRPKRDGPGSSSSGGSRSDCWQLQVVLTNLAGGASSSSAGSGIVKLPLAAGSSSWRLSADTAAALSSLSALGLDVGSWEVAVRAVPPAGTAELQVRRHAAHVMQSQPAGPCALALCAAVRLPCT
jgi:hypothetical protein